MDARRWGRIEELFLAAVEKVPEQRSGFLDEACAGDLELQHDVQRLLAADARAADRVAGVVGRAVSAFDVRLPPGTRLGAYEIADCVGEGGMGTVYRACRRDDVFDKQVAIKVVKDGIGSQDAVRRFHRERRILAQLEHPGIARILDGGSTDDGLPYLVMEYVDGPGVLEYADAHRLDRDGRLQLFLQICDAVEYAHRHQVVHRDLKPGNILIDGDGRPRLLDFGIARLVGSGSEAFPVTGHGAGLLTPRYSSPEQLRAEPATPASDVYSLGVILYELLTGCAVHRAADDSPAAIAWAVCAQDVPPPSQAATAAGQEGRFVPVPAVDLTPALDSVVLMALDKDPEQRYPSAQAFADGVQSVLEPSPPAARRPGTARRALPPGRGRRAVALTATAAALVALVMVRVYLQPPGAVAAPSGKIMLAVLPLENLTGSEEQQPFVDGLHEEIISRLGRLQPERLGVIARTSVLQYRLTAPTVAEIGRELRVHYVIEGSVRQAGGRVRVTAQLIQVSDQTHLWVETFERETSDLFSVQREIATSVADSLQLEVLPSVWAALDRHERLSAEAYTTYLRGRFFWHRRWIAYPANAERARDRFLDVIAVAPGSADALAALGQTYQYLSTYPAAPGAQQALLGQARAALSRSLAVDPGNGTARAALAWIAFRDEWDWAGAEREFQQALQLDPNDADIHQQYATLLAYSGRHSEADREIRAAQELDPLSPTLHVSAFYVHVSGRRWEKAEGIARKLAELIPGGTRHLYFSSLVDALRGDCAAALDRLASVMPAALRPEPGSLAEEHLAGYVIGRCGKQTDARLIVDALERWPGYFAHRLGTIYAGLGDTDSALAWLEESVRRHEEMATSIFSDPRLDGLRGEPRFEQLLREVGFPRPD